MAAILIVSRGILLLDRTYELGMLSSCAFLVVAFTCRGGADARVLEILLNLPFFVVVYAPIVLVGVIIGLLNTGAIDNQLGLGLTLVMSIAIAWFVPGTIGIVRSIADTVRPLRN